MKITPTSGLSPDEIELLIAEAASAAGRDQHIKELINLRNRLDSLLRNAQRTFREVASLLTPDEREDAQHVFESCANAAQSEDEDEIKSALTKIERIAMMLTMAMLNAPGGGGDSTPGAHAGKDKHDPAFERF
jgi:molecular chaperone DnaK